MDYDEDVIFAIDYKLTPGTFNSELEEVEETEEKKADEEDESLSDGKMDKDT